VRLFELNPAVVWFAVLLFGIVHTEAASADPCPTPSFAPPRAFAAGNLPGRIASGDFNGDGKLDLAVGREGQTDNTSVLFGNGDGTFQAPVGYGIAGSLSAVADLNGDGKLDLVVVNTESRFISVLAGNGDGTFQAAVNIAVGVGVFVVGDFNNDGKPDLAVSRLNTLLLGKGDGTFRPPVQFADGHDFGFMASGDFDGDGKLDLAAAGEEGVLVLQGKGDGTFQSPSSSFTGTASGSVAVGDFNNDGDLDLVAAKWLSNSVSVLLGRGDGTFATPLDFVAARINALDVAVSDFNGDGAADLVVSDFVGLSVLLGKGDGTFETATNYVAGGYNYSVTVGDFNGDGRPDIASASALGVVWVLLNTCNAAGLHLTVLHTNNNVNIAWPFPSPGFVVESTTNLSLTNWQHAIEMPKTSNARLEISAPLNPPQRFFRLRKP
jgi:hypothetical protein